MWGNDNKVAMAQWLLDRNIAWIAAAEAKAGFIVAVDTVMFAGLAATYNDAKTLGWITAILTGASAVMLGLSVLFAAFAVKSRLGGPTTSLIYFGRVAAVDMQTYAAAVQSANPDDWLADLIRQIHRNAEIAEVKHRWTRRSMQAAFAGAPTLGAALVTLLAK